MCPDSHCITIIGHEAAQLCSRTHNLKRCTLFPMGLKWQVTRELYRCPWLNIFNFFQNLSKRMFEEISMAPLATLARFKWADRRYVNGLDTKYASSNVQYLSPCALSSQLFVKVLIYL